MFNTFFRDQNIVKTCQAIEAFIKQNDLESMEDLHRELLLSVKPQEVKPPSPTRRKDG